LSFPQANSPASFEMVRKWLGNCVADHSLCSCPTDEIFYPSRLLQVRCEDGTEMVRLVTTEKSPAGYLRYLALSHCWGSSSEEERKLKITTKANLAERTTNIASHSLPRLYQDAIQIVRSLGESYLWIDSLCIIQDSDEDWFHESMLMGKIYEHAYCTISADSASGSNCPIFKERNVSSSVSALESLKYRPSYIDWGPGREPSSSSTYFPEFHHWSDLIVAEPLSTRAWALQERQLSRRIVHYTSHQILWECVTMNASEIFPEGLPQTPTKDEVLRTQPIGPSCHITLSAMLAKAARNRDVTGSSSESMFLWYWFVTEFSKRNLTIPEDKLPALSGIANSLINITGKDYVAGLWRDDLCRGLLWSASHATNCTHTRLGSAPSWSWASITGSIKFQTYCDPEDFLLDIMEISVIPVSERNPTGRLKSGTLKVQGYLRSGRWDDTSQEKSRTSGTEESFVRKTIIWEDGTRLERTSVYFDAEDDSDRINGYGSLYFLCLYGSMGHMYCMALLRVCKEMSKYRRIGLLVGASMRSYNYDAGIYEWLGQQEKTYLEIE
jgi:hypothetical protein